MVRYKIKLMLRNVLAIDGRLRDMEREYPWLTFG